MKKTLLILIIAGLLLSIGLLAGCSKEEEFVSAQEQLAIDLVIIDQYLADNNITAIKHESGLRYTMDVEGTGSMPTLSSTVKVKYEGRFMSNEEIFDTNEALEFTLAGVINGWKIGIPLFSEGGRGTLYIPSGHAYGRNGRSGIPGNAILIFDIELLKVK